MKKKLAIYFSYLVSAVFLYMTLRGIDYSEVLKSLKSFDAELVLFASIIYLFSFLFRGFRLKLILDNEIDNKVAVSSNLIAYALNNFLPLKGGDIYKIYFLKKHGNVRKSVTTASVLIERLFDLVAVLTIFLLMIYFLNLDAATWKITSLVNVVLVMFLLLAIMLFVVSRYKHLNIEKLLKFANPDSLHVFMDCWRKLLTHKHFASVLFLSLLIWLIEGLVFYVVIGYDSMSLALIWMSTLALSFVIPNAPGNIGLFEWVSIFVLTRFGFGEEQALSTGLMVHALQFTTLGVVGLILFYIYKKRVG